MTTAAVHTNVIAGETPTLSPFAQALHENLDKQHELGQFLTPSPVAEFMASLFEIYRNEVNLLDAGAGAGALSAALVGRLCREPRKPKRISVTAYEIDGAQIESLRDTLDNCRRECERAGISFSATVLNEDFITAEGIQRGVTSGALTHTTIGRNEPGVAHFERAVDKAVST